MEKSSTILPSPLLIRRTLTSAEGSRIEPKNKASEKPVFFCEENKEIGKKEKENKKIKLDESSIFVTLQR